jgi:hypothetical protein
MSREVARIFFIIIIFVLYGVGGEFMDWLHLGTVGASGGFFFYRIREK